jgi:diguanylate cyclase (GGDEF)-like protein
LVEDEEELRESVATNISYFLKDVVTAIDGQDGYEKFINTPDIDIIITDIMMPRLNGIEMIDKIREIDKDIPVIYNTAFNDSEYMLKTIKQNVSGYILKPIDIEELLKAIAKASIIIENKKLKESLIEQNKNLTVLVDKKTQELKKQNEKLLMQLFTDELTKLPNRKKLIKDLEKTASPVLILIDIDSFKNINDIYGEKFGNEVLKNIAAKIQEFNKDHNYNLYRIGPDEFAILKDTPFDEKTQKDYLKDLYNAFFNSYLHIEAYDISLKINITIGVSYDKKNTLEFADMALKKAKEQNKEFVIYNEDDNINKEYESYMLWTKIIQEAIEDKNVIPYLQPIVDKNGNVIKYESLMRIFYNSKIYSPFYFLDIAKKTKLYSSIEEQMIKKCFDFVEKNKQNITINITIEDILDENFIEFIKEYFTKYNIGKYITFEFLESENIFDYSKVINFIDLVKSYGCAIAIDDFGSGYSNFVYLTKLKPDFIKIDGTLIKDIDTDKNSKIIVETINNFAHAMGIKTVAEYVHNQEVFDILKELDVDYFQGYYFGEPQQW